MAMKKTPVLLVLAIVAAAATLTACSHAMVMIHGPSRFDRYVDAISDTGRGDGILTSDEIAGLKLFIGKANCTQC
jgi:cytochrome c peroxidase